MSKAQNIWETIVFKCNMPDINIAYDSSDYKYINYNEDKTLIVNAVDSLNNKRGLQEFFIENTNLRHEVNNNSASTRLIVPPYYYSFDTDTNNRIISTVYYNFDSCLYKEIYYDYYLNVIMTSVFECYYNRPDKCFGKVFHNNKLFQMDEYIPQDYLKPDPKLKNFIEQGKKVMRIKSKLYDLDGDIYMDEYFDFDDNSYKNKIGKK